MLKERYNKFTIYLSIFYIHAYYIHLHILIFKYITHIFNYLRIFRHAEIKYENYFSGQLRYIPNFIYHTNLLTLLCL